MGCPWMNGGPTASEKFEHFRSRTTIVGAFLFAIRGDIGRMGIRPPLFIGAADHVSLLKDFGVHNQVHSKCPVQTAVVDQFTLAKLYSVKALGQKRNRRYQEGKQTIANWVAEGERECLAKAGLLPYHKALAMPAAVELRATRMHFDIMSYTRAVRNQQKTVKTSTKSSAAGAIAAPQLKAPFMCHLLAAASSAADDKEFPIGLELNMEDWRPRFLGIKCHFQDLPLPGRRQRLVLLIIELFE